LIKEFARWNSKIYKENGFNSNGKDIIISYSVIALSQQQMFADKKDHDVITEFLTTQFLIRSPFYC
jgi:hypothetical protein